MLVFLISLAASGLVIGALGRLFLIGPDPMSIWETMAIGLAASGISFAVVRLVAGPHAMPGIVLTVFVATLLVYAVRRYRARSAASGGSEARERPGRGQG